jgi:CheY-like chemotaxis protein
VSGAILLLVVNSREERVLFNQCLRTTPHRIIVSTDGEDAFDRWSEAKPDLIICHLYAARLDGTLLCQLIRREGPMGGAVPFVLYSEDFVESVRALSRAQAIGADATLPWPFTPEQLHATIGPLLQHGRPVVPEAPGSQSTKPALEPIRTELDEFRERARGSPSEADSDAAARWLNESLDAGPTDVGADLAKRVTTRHESVTGEMPLPEIERTPWDDGTASDGADAAMAGLLEPAEVPAPLADPATHVDRLDGSAGRLHNEAPLDMIDEPVAPVPSAQHREIQFEATEVVDMTENLPRDRVVAQAEVRTISSASDGETMQVPVIALEPPPIHRLRAPTPAPPPASLPPGAPPEGRSPALPEIRIRTPDSFILDEPVLPSGPSNAFALDAETSGRTPTHERLIREIPRDATPTPSGAQKAHDGEPARSRRGLDESHLGKRLARRVESIHGLLGELDHYQILGLDPDADARAIREAYFELSLEFHPDRFFLLRSGDLKAKIYAIYRRVSEAYEVLSDERRRDQYDGDGARSRRRVRSGGEAKANRGSDAPPSHRRLEVATATAAGREFVELAQHALDSGDLNGARLFLTFALVKEPDCSDLWRAIGEVARMRRRTVAAQQLRT